MRLLGGHIKVWQVVHLKKKAIKKTVAAVVIIIVLLILVCAAALVRLHGKTAAVQNDYSAVLHDEKYQRPARAEGVEVITQDVSCGYAVLEMFSRWNGGDLTEEDLYAEYGKVVTSTGKAFCEEVNKRFPEYSTTMRSYLTNTELLDTVYACLSEGKPVPVEWAALYGDDWTLHYSLIVGMDIPNDTVTVANPYGYMEEVPVAEFLERTSFEAYEHMPLFLKLGFAFGFFEKNTVFTVA